WTPAVMWARPVPSPARSACSPARTSPTTRNGDRMPVRLNISLAGDVQIDRELLRMRNAVVDARPAFEKIALMISQFTVKHFASEGGGGAGGRWSSGHWAP